MEEIRHTNIEDVEAIYSMLREEGWGIYAKYLVEGLINTDYALSLKLVIDNRIIGGLGAMIEDLHDKSATLNYIVIDRQHRKNGYASKLMNSLFDEYKNMGVKKIALDTLDKRLFEKFGFREIARIPNWEDNKDKIFMIKEL